MTESEMLQINVEEFSRIQQYMIAAGRETDVYKMMKIRYAELKVILQATGLNLTSIDVINE